MLGTFWKILRHTDEINPQAKDFRKEAKAEEIIICYLMYQHEEASKLRQQVPPEIFVTDFNRKVYEAILEIADTQKEFSLSILNEVFSAEEMGKISGIRAKNEGIEINNASITDCAAVLKNHVSLKTAENISDDELKNIFTSKNRK